jgi:hypothetical protein
MSEPRRIIVGVIPSGQDVTFVGEGAGFTRMRSFWRAAQERYVFLG